ncbi:hypothetical protein F2Q65_15260 [Thiohalocapsa marina]|uniref:Uncharacterized protein n=1 Tax=Thiohalocapsa marina TaxID=424902 RepID=A0A5M8FK38_9GAMM|nr:hypothetical protein [Thiohalocapsa marina]KAA6183551.1 hypothetical protein F2Q65_15260 [Thiohalocapsa marina]
MRVLSFVLLTLFVVPLCSASEFTVWTVPARPQVEVSSTTVVKDGIKKTVKAPYIPLQLMLKSHNASSSITLATVDVSVSVPGVSTDRYSFTISPYITLQPGQSEKSDIFYLDGLRQTWGSEYQIRVSVNGWRGTGTNPSDRIYNTFSFDVQPPASAR